MAGSSNPLRLRPIHAIILPFRACERILASEFSGEALSALRMPDTAQVLVLFVSLKRTVR